MDALSLTVGILIGGIVFGLISFFAGVAIGSMAGKIDSARSLWNEFAGDAARRLDHGEMYSVHFSVGKHWADDDDDGGDEGGDEGEWLRPQLDGSVRFN